MLSTIAGSCKSRLPVEAICLGQVGSSDNQLSPFATIPTRKTSRAWNVSRIAQYPWTWDIIKFSQVYSQYNIVDRANGAIADISLNAKEARNSALVCNMRTAKDVV